MIKKSWMYAWVALAAVACNEDNPVPIGPIEENPEGNFIVSTLVPDAANATYFLSVASLENETDTISPKGAGLEFTNTFTHYASAGYSGLVGLKYGQGNAHIGQRFTIDAAGSVVRVGAQFEIQNGFVTAGNVGDYVYTIMSGFRAADKTVGTMNRIGLSTGDPQFNTFKVNEFAGYVGENAALIGVADGGDGSFFSGLHFHENEDIDDVVVAKINATSLNTAAVYSDTRLSISGGFFRSARYSQIGAADNGDVYVFSGNNFGTKKAGALVIKKGATTFDQSYFWDIEAASGGYRFRKVWHLKGDIFLLEFYNDKFAAGEETVMATPATQFAVLAMSDKKFTWVTGIPDQKDILDGQVSWPYVFGGKAYIGITALNKSPQFFALDPATGVAKKGLVVKDASKIDATTFVEKK